MIKIANCNSITLYDDIINKLSKENIYIENCEFIYFMSSDKHSNECSDENDTYEQLVEDTFEILWDYIVEHQDSSTVKVPSRFKGSIADVIHTLLYDPEETPPTKEKININVEAAYNTIKWKAYKLFRNVMPHNVSSLRIQQFLFPLIDDLIRTSLDGIAEDVRSLASSNKEIDSKLDDIIDTHIDNIKNSLDRKECNNTKINRD